MVIPLFPPWRLLSSCLSACQPVCQDAQARPTLPLVSSLADAWGMAWPLTWGVMGSRRSMLRRERGGDGGQGALSGGRRARIRCRDARHGVISGRISGAGRVVVVVVGMSLVLFPFGFKSCTKRFLEGGKGREGHLRSHAVS